MLSHHSRIILRLKLIFSLSSFLVYKDLYIISSSSIQKEEIQRHKRQKEVIKRREGLNIDLLPTPRRIQKESSSTSITSPTSITSSQSTPQENPIVLPGTPQASSSTLQPPPKHGHHVLRTPPNTRSSNCTR